jgi:hypothetical protein
MAGARVVSSISHHLEKFSAEVVQKVARSGAAAGARLLYDEMRERAPVKSGVLKSSIYWWHDDKASGPLLERYIIGPNMKKAPHWHLLEYGHWRVNVVVRGPGGRLIATKERLPKPVWVAPRPYIRPTYDSQKSAAIGAARQRMAERLRELTSAAASGSDAGTAAA